MLRSVIILIIFIILGFFFIQGCESREENWESILSTGEINSQQKIGLQKDTLTLPSDYEFHHHYYHPERRHRIVLDPIGERINSDFLYVGFIKTIDNTIGPAVITPVVVSVEKNVAKNVGRLEIIYLDLPNKPNVLKNYLIRKGRNSIIKNSIKQATKATIFAKLSEKFKNFPFAATINKASTRVLGVSSVFGLYKDAYNLWRNNLDLYDLEPIGLIETYDFHLNRSRITLVSNSKILNSFEKENPTDVSAEEIPIMDFKLDASKEGRIIKGAIQIANTTSQIIELTLSDKLLHPEDAFNEIPRATGINPYLNKNSIFKMLRGKEFYGKCRLVKENNLLEEFDVMISFFERSDSKIEMIIETTPEQYNKKYFFNKTFFYFSRQWEKLKFHGNAPHRGYFYESLELDEPSPDNGWFPYLILRIGFDKSVDGGKGEVAREGRYIPFDVNETTLEVSEDASTINGSIKTSSWELELDLATEQVTETTK